MGFFDSFSELVAAATPWSAVEAEAPEKPDEKPEEKDEGAEESEGKEDSEEGDDSKEADAPEEEEEEEEMVDPKETLEEECKESKQCAPAKHHFDECVERVTGAEEGKPVSKKHPGEDCVEEFFHLAHCAGQCAAPKLWAQLK